MPLPKPLLDLAARQHSLLARRQALEYLTADEYDGLLRHGRLRSEQRGVAAIAGSEQTPQQRLMAALLRAGRGARITGPAVLGLFDVDGFSPADPFEVLLPPGRRLTNVDFPTRTDPLPGQYRALFGALAVAKLPLALVDAPIFARVLGQRRLRVGLDSARWKGLTGDDDIITCVDLLPSDHPGADWFRQLDRLGELRAESEGERRLLRALAPVRPAPRRQAWITDHIRVDLLWDTLRVVGEYQGWIDHGPDAAPLDAARRGQIEDEGYVVIEYRAADLADPDATAARTQLLLVARARELGIPLL